MDNKKMTAAMIDTAVSRGIREMADDPKRTIRKLADMGREFSTGRFQPMLFELFQQLLENDDSPYYDMLQYFLGHTDKENIKKFGINMGYYSWTYYARTLRECSEARGYAIPWAINFIYNPSDIANKLTVEDIRRTITEARTMGVNTFTVALEGSCTPGNDLFAMFNDFEESAFFLFLGDSQITVAQQSMLKKCGNTMLVVNCASEDALSTCDALNVSGNLYSIYYKYNSDDVEKFKSRDYYEDLHRFPASMLFLIPERKSTRSAGDIVKEIRMKQECPYFIWDFPADTEQIGDILCGDNMLLIFDQDGTVCEPDSCKLSLLSPDVSLESILETIMPKIKIA